MKIVALDSIDRIPAPEWDRLAGNQPFLTHAFLAALEHSGCVTDATGWAPQHLCCRDSAGRLLGALPLYLKSHSYGEYVFDWAWADAYRRTGRDYYPKLVAAVPFSPVTGPRLLIADDADRRQVGAGLLAQCDSLAREHSASSIHGLFLAPAELGEWTDAGFLSRQDCQFHWQNRGYETFEDFLGQFTAEKRKKVRRERRRVAEAGIRFRVYRGDELDEELLHTVYRFYAATYEKRLREPYLNLAFFEEIVRALPKAMWVNVASLDSTPVAAAVFYRDHDTLYGRHWGCGHEYHSLHFETCYYQGIEYCIREQLQHFNPGTQGEHKLSRGFEPVLTASAHRLLDARFQQAVDDFLRRERRLVESYYLDARKHLPFHADAGQRGAAA